MSDTSKKCADCWGKIVKFSAILLVLWGVGYALNTFIHVCTYWSDFSAFIIFKAASKRLGVSLAAILFGSLAMLCKETCCGAGSCAPKAD